MSTPPILLTTPCSTSCNGATPPKKMNPPRWCLKTKVDRIGPRAWRPASSGLQPFEVFVVTDPATALERIKPIAWNQGQITDSSHLLVFTAWERLHAERINRMFDLRQRGAWLPRNEKVGKTTATCCWHLPQRDAGEPPARSPPGLHWHGASIIAAAFEGVDSTPWKASTRRLDEILGLRARACAAVLHPAAGLPRG